MTTFAAAGRSKGNPESPLYIWILGGFQSCFFTLNRNSEFLTLKFKSERIYAARFHFRDLCLVLRLLYSTEYKKTSSAHKADTVHIRHNTLGY